MKGECILGVAPIDQRFGLRRYRETSTGLVSPWLENAIQLKRWAGDKTWTIERDLNEARLKAFDPQI